MGTVFQHNVAEIAGGLCGEYLPLKALRIDQWKQACVIDVGVGDKDVVHIGERDRKLRVLIDVSALFHTVINKNVLSRRIQIMTASSHFMICTDKCQFHGTPPFAAKSGNSCKHPIPVVDIQKYPFFPTVQCPQPFSRSPRILSFRFLPQIL